jgi:DNA-binding MarR family transcriptional regulator
MQSIDRSSPSELIAAIVGELRGSLRELRCGTLERMIGLGVSMTQMHVLWLLEHHGEVPMSRLAELLDVSLSNSTGLIDRMEERGLVERTRVPDDRRLVVVRLGPEGIRILGQLQALQHDRLQRALARVDPGRLGGVLEAFTEFHSAIEADLGAAGHIHCTDRSTAVASPALPASPSR